jgi:DNA-binding PadR family transcriptional regulator
MEAAGLIAAEALARGERGIRRAYSLTPAGARELVRWVAGQEAAPPVRAPAYLTATHLEYGSFDEARRRFREHRPPSGHASMSWKWTV